MSTSCDKVEQALMKMSPGSRGYRKKAKQLIKCRKNEGTNDWAEMAIIVPKKDNAGNPFRKDVIDDIKLTLSKKFGGVTVFNDVSGCYVWKGQEGELKPEIKCEDNMIMTSVTPRDNLPTARRFIDRLGKRIGINLGQESILTSRSLKGVDFIPGRKTKSKPRQTIKKKKYPEDVDID